MNGRHFGRAVVAVLVVSAFVGGTVALADPFRGVEERTAVDTEAAAETVVRQALTQTETGNYELTRSLGGPDEELIPFRRYRVDNAAPRVRMVMMTADGQPSTLTVVTPERSVSRRYHDEDDPWGVGPSAPLAARLYDESALADVDARFVERSADRVVVRLEGPAVTRLVSVGPDDPSYVRTANATVVVDAQQGVLRRVTTRIQFEQNGEVLRAVDRFAGWGETDVEPADAPYRFVDLWRDIANDCDDCLGSER